jgi:prophage regulatory protein
MGGNKLLRLPQVESTTGLKKSTIYERIKQGKFPTSVKLGAKAVAWRSDEIEDWIESRPRTVRVEE